MITPRIQHLLQYMGEGESGYPEKVYQAVENLITGNPEFSYWVLVLGNRENRQRVADVLGGDWQDQVKFQDDPNIRRLVLVRDEHSVVQLLLSDAAYHPEAIFEWMKKHGIS